jgi:hypothetical protein
VKEVAMVVEFGTRSTRIAPDHDDVDATGESASAKEQS